MPLPTIQIYFLLIICISQSTYSQNTAQYTASQFTSNDISQFLDHHNKARSELNLAHLNWNEDIAAHAQEWADYLAANKNCKLIHRYQLKKNEPDYGENIYWGSSADLFTPLDASIAWYGEKVFFKNEPVSMRGILKTGHYTQMIWESTSEVGAGKAICPSGGIIIVANYNPAGNIIGSLP